MKPKELKNVMSEELALNELEKFINEWVDKPEPRENLTETYPNIYDALISGNLILDGNNEPTYKLIKPVTNEDGSAIIKEEVNFKTRITPTNQARLGKGIDINTNQMQFMLICIAHIIGCSVVAELDRFSKKDYKTIREICTVFI